MRTSLSRSSLRAQDHVAVRIVGELQPGPHHPARAVGVQAVVVVEVEPALDVGHHVGLELDRAHPAEVGAAAGGPLDERRADARRWSSTRRPCPACRGPRSRRTRWRRRRRRWGRSWCPRRSSSPGTRDSYSSGGDLEVAAVRARRIRARRAPAARRTWTASVTPGTRRSRAARCTPAAGPAAAKIQARDRRHRDEDGLAQPGGPRERPRGDADRLRRRHPRAARRAAARSPTSGCSCAWPPTGPSAAPSSRAVCCIGSGSVTP